MSFETNRFWPWDVDKGNPLLEKLQAKSCNEAMMRRVACEQVNGLTGVCERYQQEEKQCVAFNLCPKAARRYYGDEREEGACSFLMTQDPIKAGRIDRNQRKRCADAARIMNTCMSKKLHKTRDKEVLARYEKFLDEQSGGKGIYPKQLP